MCDLVNLSWQDEKIDFLGDIQEAEEVENRFLPCGCLSVSTHLLGEAIGCCGSWHLCVRSSFVKCRTLQSVKALENRVPLPIVFTLDV